MSPFQDVLKFMLGTGQLSVDSKNKELQNLYLKLIREEYQELEEAVCSLNETETIDACFDLIWVIIGYMYAKGWNDGDLDEIWNEGSYSNLSKIDPVTGMVKRREDGKILKPEGWKPPNFSKFTHSYFDPYEDGL